MTRLSSDERRAIASLKRLAKRWPKSLVLFAGNGGLSVLRAAPGGGLPMTERGTVDGDREVAEVDIPADGGGW